MGTGRTYSALDDACDAKLLMPSACAKNEFTDPDTVTSRRRLLVTSWSGVTVTPPTPVV